VRSAEDFVNEMLRKKRSWSAILSVSGAIRGGSWRKRVKEILKDKGLIPEDHEAMLSERDQIIKKQRAEKVKKEKKRRAKIRKGRKKCRKKKSTTRTAST